MTESATPYETFATSLARLSRSELATTIALLEETTAPRMLREAVETSGTEIAGTIKRVAESRPAQAAARATAARSKGLWARVSRTAAGARVAPGASRASAYAGRGVRAGHRTTVSAVQHAKAGSACERVTRRTDGLSNGDLDLLRARLVEVLSGRLGVRPIAGDGPRWYHDVLVEIAAAAGVDPTVYTDERLVGEIVHKLLLQLAKDLENGVRDGTISDEDQDAIVDQVIEQLRCLDAEALEQAMEAMGVQDLSREEVKAALRRGALATAPVGAVAATGFGVYLFASAMLKAVAILVVHHTLHFGAFVAMSKSLGLLLHHPLLAGALGTASALVVMKNRSELNRRMAGIALLGVLATTPATMVTP